MRPPSLRSDDGHCSVAQSRARQTPARGLAPASVNRVFSGHGHAYAPPLAAALPRRQGSGAAAQTRWPGKPKTLTFKKYPLFKKNSDVKKHRRRRPSSGLRAARPSPCPTSRRLPRTAPATRTASSGPHPPRRLAAAAASRGFCHLRAPRFLVRLSFPPAGTTLCLRLRPSTCMTVTASASCSQFSHRAGPPRSIHSPRGRSLHKMNNEPTDPDTSYDPGAGLVEPFRQEPRQ